MHDKIKELWEKAATASAAYPSGQNNSWETQVNFMDKFAELIVQECIDIIAPYTIRMGRPGEEYLHPIQEIKKHFGVEE